MNLESTVKHKQLASTSGLVGVAPTFLALGDGKSRSRLCDVYRKEN